MHTKRKIARWENAIRQQAVANARALDSAVVAGTAWMPPPYDLGIVLEPGEIIWHRCPATYRWRGTEACTVEDTSYWGRRSAARHIVQPRMFYFGITDWVVTNHRLAARAPDGQFVSIYWAAIGGLSVDRASEVVVLDAADGYHGELCGPAIAPSRCITAAYLRARRVARDLRRRRPGPRDPFGGRLELLIPVMFRTIYDLGLHPGEAQ